MITSNNSGFDISLRWNPYLRTFMADVVIDSKQFSYPLRVGKQTFRGITSVVDVQNECHRYDCDIRDADIRFS